MFKRNKKRRPTVAPGEVAGQRAGLYELLVHIFSQLPDQGLVKTIEGRLLEDLFHGFEGVEYLKAYRSMVSERPLEDVLNELAVDRTRILRGTGPNELKPPYEGCYKMDHDLGAAAIKVRCFYRAGGLLPDETVPDSPDYLCVELDFMKHLCRREDREWASKGSAAETIDREATFLRDHLGSWVGDYCGQVEKHALTDFYRGMVLILKDFIEKEMTYLGGLER